jgi:hypothetical protein
VGFTGCFSSKGRHDDPGAVSATKRVRVIALYDLFLTAEGKMIYDTTGGFLLLRQSDHGCFIFGKWIKGIAFLEDGKWRRRGHTMIILCSSETRPRESSVKNSLVTAQAGSGCWRFRYQAVAIGLYLNVKFWLTTILSTSGDHSIKNSLPVSLATTA